MLQEEITHFPRTLQAALSHCIDRIFCQQTQDCVFHHFIDLLISLKPTLVRRESLISFAGIGELLVFSGYNDTFCKCAPLMYQAT